MFLLYLGISSLCLIFAVYFGLKLAEPIKHPILYLIFWLLYVISILSLLNIITSGAFFVVLRYKRGPPGIPGPKGEKGPSGKSGECEETCKEDLCQKTIIDKLTKEFNRLMTEVKQKDIEPPLAIKNGFIKETVKRICHSTQFKDVSRIKKPYLILEYITEVWMVWIKLLFDADPSSEKDRFKTWLETHGADNEWEAITEGKPNPFDEIKKYDIYYWGLSKEFHPIKIHHCKSKLGLKDNVNDAKIPAIESNFYDWIYNDRKTGSHQNIEIWRAKPIKYKGKTYYSLGDIGLSKYGGEYSRRYFREYQTPSRGMTDVGKHSRDGPSSTTILVDGSSPHVAVPKQYDLKWNDKKSGGRHDTAFWMPRDFSENGKNYKCFGGLAGKKTYKDPFSVYGKGDTHPIRCIDESCLEEIPQQSYRIWRDRGSGARLDGSVWTNNHPNFKPYKTVYFPNKTHQDVKRKFYKIKENCLRSNAIADEEEETIEDKTSYGWHGTAKRDAKYSVFSFLDLVIESKIVNPQTGQVYYLAHTGAKTPNSYFVKPLNTKTNTYTNCLKVRGGVSYTNGTCNLNDKDEVWEVEFSSFDTNIFFLKSISRGTYLYLEKSKNGVYYPRNKDIGNKKTDQQKTKAFHWYLEEADTQGKINKSALN